MVSSGIRRSLKRGKRGWAAEGEGDLCTSAFRGFPCQAAPRVAHSQFPRAQGQVRGAEVQDRVLRGCSLRGERQDCVGGRLTQQQELQVGRR